MACCWHGIGSLTTDTSWLDVHNIRDRHVSFQYATAMRWSLAQLGLGGTQIEAVSYVESVYSGIVAFVSLMSFSTVISSMTSLITSLNKAKVEETDQFWLLQKYLREKDIAGSLAERITDFLQYAYHSHTAQLAERPDILHLLSRPLQGELNLSLYQDSLLKVSFLAQVSQSTAAHSTAFHKLASESVHIVDTGAADVVFSASQDAETTFFLLKGSLRYQHVPSGERHVDGRGWIAEMALWTKWLHAGDLVSTGFSKLVAISPLGSVFCLYKNPRGY